MLNKAPIEEKQMLDKGVETEEDTRQKW